MENKKIKKLFQVFPKTYSEELGINLWSKNPEEIFKWFLASVLFGKRISEQIAKNTYEEFEREDLLTPESILEAGWDKLVEILDRGGGYVRYDFSTASRLLDIMKDLKESGGLMELYKRSKNSEDFENKLKDFKGVGDVTANIFLRELRFMDGINPKICRFVEISARNLDINLERDRKTQNFIRLESALLRLGKDYCRKKKCKVCPVRKYCRSFPSH